MGEDRTLEVLKEAILLETRGRSFYRGVAQNAKSDAVKRFFELMANEEDAHVHILTEQYKQFVSTNRFVSDIYADAGEPDTVGMILSDQVKMQISAAGVEAAAISAAIALEEKAVKLYSGRAAASEILPEKALYEWLANWEKQHLHVLTAIDRELTERIWNDNQFWPF